MVSQILYYNQNQQYPKIQKDYQDVKNHVSAVDKTDKGLFYALESIPTFRRVASLGDKIDNGDALPAIGLASLAVINLPEDMRDVKAGFKQVFDHKNYKPAYNFKDYQHTFSFFRGGLLKNMANPNKSRSPKFAKKLYNADRTLIDTKFGSRMMDLLNTNVVHSTNTTIEDALFTKENPVYVEALKFKGKGSLKGFGELTARAMTRTSRLGVFALAALEVPKIFKAMNKGDTLSEQTGSTIKQTVKSGVNLASITAGIAYGGAIGAKHGKAMGSLVGMGLGAIVGAFTSKKVQDVIG